VYSFNTPELNQFLDDGLKLRSVRVARGRNRELSDFAALIQAKDSKDCNGKSIRECRDTSSNPSGQTSNMRVLARDMAHGLTKKWLIPGSFGRNWRNNIINNSSVAIIGYNFMELEFEGKKCSDKNQAKERKYHSNAEASCTH
jgi:hypothetical protein